MRRLLLRGSRVVLHSVVGGVLVVAGLVMLVTPGQGIVTLVLGLAVLAREFRWADRLKHLLLDRVRDASTRARASLAARRGSDGPPPVVTELPNPSEDRPEGPPPDHPDSASGRIRPAS